MSQDAEFGHIEYPPGRKLAIINCSEWRLKGMEPHCLKGLDLQCGSCASRKPREEPLSAATVFTPSEAAKAPEPIPEPATKQRWRGLGDVVASATSAVGIKPCSGCAKRQESLNRAFPFGKRPEPPVNP